MKMIRCKNRKNEKFVLLKNSDGLFFCPVCGSPEFTEAPYYEDGSASFQLCACGFEFGYDDSPLATKEAVEGIKANWDRWRLNLIEQCAQSTSDLKKLENNLNNLGISLTSDLFPVKKHDDT